MVAWLQLRAGLTCASNWVVARWTSKWYISGLEEVAYVCGELEARRICMIMQHTMSRNCTQQPLTLARNQKRSQILFYCGVHIMDILHGMSRKN